MSEVVLLSHGLSSEAGTALRAAIKQHIAFIQETDWPAMASLRANLQSQPAGLKTAMAMLLTSKTTDQGQEVARQRALQAIERAYGARESRIRLSKAEIAPIQWTVIIMLSTLILLTTAMIHIGKPAAMAVTLFFFSTATAVCFLLLMAYDRPFAAGGVSLAPTVFREIVLE